MYIKNLFKLLNRTKYSQIIPIIINNVSANPKYISYIPQDVIDEIIKEISFEITERIPDDIENKKHIEDIINQITEDIINDTQHGMSITINNIDNKEYYL